MYIGWRTAGAAEAIRITTSLKGLRKRVCSTPLFTSDSDIQGQ
jgi:hypothetical protein